MALKTPDAFKKDLVKRHLIMQTKQKDKLIQQLSRLKIDYHEEQDKIIADLKKHDVQKTIQSITVPLTYLDIHNPSLEDAYLELIGGEHAGN